MNRKLILLLSGALLLIVAAALFFLFPRRITLVVDGQPQALHSTALTVGAALEQAGIPQNPQDIVQPAPATWLRPGMEIQILRAHRIWIEDAPGQPPIEIISTAHLPTEWLTQANITLTAQDVLLLNGQAISPQEPLPPQPSYLLQVRRAVPLTLQIGEEQNRIQSSAETLATALWQAGVQLAPADRLSLPSNTALNQALVVRLQRAVPLTITIQGQSFQAASAAETIGQALAENGFPLLGLDYSIPDAAAPLPEDGQIRIVRVREEITLQQKLLPYGKQYVADPNTELDQRSTVQSGQFGVELARLRLRYEDGQQVASLPEAAWLIRPPIDEQIGYGTQVVVRTLETPSGTIEYWRAVNVYITSYSPCGQGNRSFCNDITASGMTLRYGILAVNESWYGWMAGQQLYIPDYGVGVVADWGYGFSDKYWVDVGYSEDDYVPWSSYRTIYFLTPVPENIPWILP